jgi:hypothetical protein
VTVSINERMISTLSVLVASLARRVMELGDLLAIDVSKVG